jgi:hypothetical protein
MSLDVLIVDGHAGIYAEHLRREFPALRIHTAPDLGALPDDLSSMDVLIAFGVAINDDVLRRLSNLKWVQSLATGVDHFLRSPTLARTALITSGRGIHGPMMREMVAFLMLSLSHNSLRQAADQKAHVWERRLWTLLYEKTAVVVGIGVSGISVGELLSAFGMKVIAVTRTPREIAGVATVIQTDRQVEAAREVGLFHQRRSRRDGRRGRPDPGAARKAHRRRGARRVQGAAAAARQPVVGHAERGDHAAHRRLRGGVRGLRDADRDRQHAAVPGRPRGRDAQPRAAVIDILRHGTGSRDMRLTGVRVSERCRRSSSRV